MCSRNGFQLCAYVRNSVPVSYMESDVFQNKTKKRKKKHWAWNQNLWIRCAIFYSFGQPFKVAAYPMGKAEGGVSKVDWEVH